MAYYDIAPTIGRGKRAGRVVGYQLNLHLSFGHQEPKFFHSSYRVVVDTWKMLKKQHPHIKDNPSIKQCLVCAKPLRMHCLCDKHETYHYRSGDNYILPFKPI